MMRIVLAYSGELDTSIAIPWLAETYGAEVIAVTIDLGQGKDLEAVRDRALGSGALRAHVLDLRDEFARDFIVRALKAGVLCREGAPLTAALSWPLIAQTLVTIAHIEDATAVAHGDSNVHQTPLDAAILALDPALKVIAPAREWAMTADQQLDYARQRGLTRPTIGGDGSVTLRGPAAPDEPAFADIVFDRGAPVAINGVAMPPLDLIGSFDIIAGVHGTARVEKMDPAALVALHTAHHELHKATVGADAKRASKAVRLGEQYLEIIRSGAWRSPARQALDVEIDALEARVNGTVRLELLKGRATLAACRPQAAGSAIIPLAKTT
ncbi:MAG TPA: argininosuccinate synthase domain-containing protein [Vicinamibacterales bacterium]|jgi:argininosuccinate synthase